MAEDYQPNPTGLLSAQSEQQMGANTANNFAKGADMGAELQQKIATTQMLHQQLQQKMLENHAAMTNQLTGRMATLAGMSDDDKKGPMWDMQVDSLKKDLNSFGAPVTPDSLDTMLTDSNYSSRLSAALNATANAGLDPVKQAAVVQKNATLLGRPDLIQNFPEEVQKELQTQMQMNFKNQGQDVRKQTLVNNVINNTTGIQKDFNKSLEYAGNIQNLLKPGVPYQTGSAQVVAMDELTKLATNTVVRQFTYDNLKGTISAPDRFMQGIDRQVNSGKPLNDKQVQDVQLIAKTLQQGSDKLRLQMLSAKHNEVKGMINNPGYAGYEDQLRGAFDPDDWNKLEDMSKKTSFNPATQKYEKPDSDSSAPATAPDAAPKKAAGFQGYSAGSNPDIDSFLKSTISNGASYQQINKLMARKKMKLSQDDYNAMKGGH